MLIESLHRNLLTKRLVCSILYTVDEGHARGCAACPPPTLKGVCLLCSKRCICLSPFSLMTPCATSCALAVSVWGAKPSSPPLAPCRWPSVRWTRCYALVAHTVPLYGTLTAITAVNFLLRLLGVNYNLHTLNLTLYLFHVIISMSKGERKVASPLERFGQCVGESVPCVTLILYNTDRGADLVVQAEAFTGEPYARTDHPRVLFC